MLICKCPMVVSADRRRVEGTRIVFSFPGMALDEANRVPKGIQRLRAVERKEPAKVAGFLGEELSGRQSPVSELRVRVGAVPKTYG